MAEEEKIDPASSLGEEEKTASEKNLDYLEESSRSHVARTGLKSMGRLPGPTPEPFAPISREEFKEAFGGKEDVAPYIDRGRALETGYIQKGEKFSPGFTTAKYGDLIPENIRLLSEKRQQRLDSDIRTYHQQLYENRSGFGTVSKIGAELVGGILVNAVGGLTGSIWGAGKALFTWDLDNFYKDNEIFDATEAATEAIDKSTYIIGAPGWDETPEGERKGFFGRMSSDPGKSFSDDVAPALQFVGGAVVSEIIVGTITGLTAGATAPALAANTARIGAQGSRLMRGYNAGRKIFSKKIKALRGIDDVGEALAKNERYINFTNKFKKGAGTMRAMITSTGYESGLIAESTRERILESLIEDYRAEHGGNEPDEYTLKEFNKIADNAGRKALLTNTVIVGGANLIQFPKLFLKGYTGERKLASGLRLKDGKWGTKWADKSKLGKVASWGFTGFKNGVVEAWEEGSQGILEEGLVDYYGKNFSEKKALLSINALKSFYKSSEKFLSSVEGKDSLSIGFLMGMFGIPLPVSTKTGKTKLGFQWYGGAFGDIQAKVQKNKKLAAIASKINEDFPGQALATALNNYTNTVIDQEDRDAALIEGDIFTYKNKEHDQLFNWVMSRMELGVEETILQDLDALENMSINEFNKNYGLEGLTPQSQQEQRAVIKKVRKRVENIINTANKVNTLYDNKRMIDNLGLKKQLIYTASMIENLNEREKELTSRVNELTNGAINADSYLKDAEVSINTGLVQEEGIGKRAPSDVYQAMVKDNITELSNKQFKEWQKGKSEEEIKKAIELRRIADLNNWTLGRDAEEDWMNTNPESFALNKDEVIGLMKDLIKIKKKRAAAGLFYNSLFTEQGANKFQKFQDRMNIEWKNNIRKALEESNKEGVKNADTVEGATQAMNDELDTTDSTKHTDNKAASENTSLNKKGPLHPVQALAEILGTGDKPQGQPALAAKLLAELGLPGDTRFEEIYSMMYDSDGLPLSEEEAVLTMDDLAAAIIKVRKDADDLANSKVNDNPPADPDDNLIYKQDSTDSKEEDFGGNLDEFVFESEYTLGQPVSENNIILMHHDRVQSNGAVVPGTDGTAALNEMPPEILKDLEKLGVTYDSSIINSPFSPVQTGSTVRVIDSGRKFPNTKEGETVIYVISQDNKFLGVLPGAGRSNNANFQALRNKVETDGVVSVTVKERTSGRVNNKVNEKSNPIELIKEYNEVNGANIPIVFVTKIGGNIKGLNVLSASKRDEYKNAAGNINEGYVYMMVPSANGKIIPIKVFTNKMKDVSTDLQTEIKNLLEKLPQAKNKEEADKIRKKLESNFSNRIIIHKDGAYSIYEKVQDEGSVAMAEGVTLDEAMAVLGESIIKFRLGPGIGKTTIEAAVENGVITTDVVLDKDGLMFHSSSIVIDQYVPEASNNTARTTDSSMATSVKDDTSDDPSTDGKLGQITPQLSKDAVKKLLRLGFSEEMLEEMTKEEKDAAKKMSSKEDAKELIETVRRRLEGDTSDVDNSDVDLNEFNLGDDVNPDDDGGFALRLPEEGAVEEQWNKEEELSWLEEKLGKEVVGKTKMFETLEDLEKYLPKEVYDMLLEAKRNGRDLMGLFSDAALYLNENAFQGTAYHEAFHVVFRLALTPQQRKELLTEAREKYKKDLSKDATDIDVEEKLADEFMEYVRSEEGTKKSLSKRIGDFFHKVFRMIKTFFSRESTININNLFKDIQSGVYKNKVKFKETDLSDIASYRTRELVRQERFENPILEQDALEYMRYKFNNVINHIRKNRPDLKNLDNLEVLIALSKDKTIREAGGDGFSYVMNYMLNSIKADAQRSKGKKSYASYIKLLSVISNTTEDNVQKGIFNTDFVKVVEKDGKTRLVFTGKTNLLKIFQANLQFQGINYKNKRSARPRNIKDDVDMREDIEDGMPTENAWDRGHMEIDQKDTLSQRLKQFFSDVPVMSSKRKGAKVIRNAFGAPMMHDFNNIYAFMIQNVSGTYTKENLMKALKAVKDKQPYIPYIISKLEENPSILADMVVHIGTKSYNKFITATWDGSDFTVFYSNRKNLDNIIQEDLIANFHKQDNILLKKNQAGGRTGENVEVAKAKEILKYLSAAKNSVGSLGLSDQNIKVLAKLIKRMSLPIAQEEIIAIIDQSENKKDNALGLINALIGVAEELAEGRNPFLYLRSKEDIENPESVGESNVVQNLASILAPIYEENVVSAFKNVENKSVYNFQLSNFLSKKMNQWADPKVFKEWYDSVKTDPTYSNSPLLKELSENLGDLEELSYVVLDGINDTQNNDKIKYSRMSPKNLEAMSMGAFQWSNNYGYFRLPIPSDSTNTAMIRLKKHSEEEIIDNLLMVAKGEIETMQKLKKIKDQNPDSDIFGVESGSGLYADKAEKFTTLTFLNGKIPTDSKIDAKLEEQIKEEIKKFLNGDFLVQQLEYYKQEGIIKQYNLEEGQIIYGNGVVNSEIQSKRPMAFMKDYLFNSFYANTQLTTLFSGNPAFYKGVTDYQKRNKQLISPRTYLDTSNTFVSKGGVEYGVGQNYQGIVLKDKYEESNPNIIEAAHQIIDDSDLTDTEKTALKVLWEKPHNTTDGQTYLHPRRYKEIMIGLNRWNQDKEAAYRRVLKGKETMQDLALFPPLKPHVYSQRMVDGFVVPTQHKNSEIMLTKSMANLKNNEGDILFPDLIKLYDMMDNGILTEIKNDDGTVTQRKEKIDVVLFESAVKVGREKVTDWKTLDAMDLSKEPLNIMQEWSNDDWGLQQETPPHHIDEINNYGTQLRNLIIEGIDPNGNYQIRDPRTGKVKKTRKGNKTAQEYQKLVVADLSMAYKEVEEMFLKSDGTVNYEGLLEELRAEVLDRGLGSDYLEALDESFDAEGKLIPNLPFIHPLHSDRIQKILNSFFKNRITKQKIAGGQFINTSSFGVSDQLKMNINKKTGQITMDVMLPAWSRKFFENGIVDFEKLKYTNPELLELVGYRIPTEHKYSMYKLNVVGFTPAVSGGQLILPREITTTTGLDFDIDKFFVMVPAFKKNEDGTYKKIEFTTDPEEAWAQYLEERVDSREAAEIAMEITGLSDPGKARRVIKTMAAPKIFEALVEKNPEYGLELFGPTENMKEEFLNLILQSENTMTKEEFMKLNTYEQNTKAARDNAKIDIIHSILTNKHTAIDILNGGNFDNLIEQSTRIRLLENGDEAGLSLNADELAEEAALLDEKQNLNINYPATQLELFKRNMAAIHLIGIMAVNNTHHAKAQFTDMKILEDYGITLDGETYTALNLRDKKITQNLATLLAAVVDNANDPVSSFLNLNTFTANLAVLYTRLGIDMDTTFYFLSSPVLKQLTRLHNNSDMKGKGALIEAQNLIEASIGMRLKKYIPKNITKPEKQKEWMENWFIDAGLKADDISKKELQEQHLEKDELKRLELDYRILTKFLQDNEIANELSQGVQAGRTDTKGVGPTQADNYVFLNQQREVINNNNPKILGLESVFVKTKDSDQIMIPGFNEFGLIKPTGLMDMVLPFNGRPNPKNEQELIYNLMGTIKNFMSDEKEFRNLTVEETALIQKDLLNYYMSGFPFFKQHQAKRVLTESVDNLQIIKEKEREKTEKGERSAYTFLLNALSVVDSSKAFPIKRIEYNKTGVSLQQEQRIRAAWSYMLNDNTELKEGYTYSDFAKDLIKYTFFQNGFNFGPYTFNHLIPIKFYSDEFQKQNDILAETKDGTKITMNEYIRSVESRIRAMEGLTYEEMLQNPEFSTFVKQFYQNNVGKMSFVRRVKPNPKGAVKFDPKAKTTIPGLKVLIGGKWQDRPAVKITITSNGPLYNDNGVPTSQEYTNKVTGQFIKYITRYDSAMGVNVLYEYEYDEVFDPENDNPSRIATYTPIANLGQNQIVKEYSIDAKDGVELVSSVGQLRELARPAIKVKKKTNPVIRKGTTNQKAPSIKTKEPEQKVEVGEKSKVVVGEEVYAVSNAGTVINQQGIVITDPITIKKAQAAFKVKNNFAAVVESQGLRGMEKFVVDPNKKEIINANGLDMVPGYKGVEGGTELMEKMFKEAREKMEAKSKEAPAAPAESASTQPTAAETSDSFEKFKGEGFDLAPNITMRNNVDIYFPYSKKGVKTKEAHRGLISYKDGKFYNGGKEIELTKEELEYLKRVVDFRVKLEDYVIGKLEKHPDINIEEFKSEDLVKSRMLDVLNAEFKKAKKANPKGTRQEWSTGWLLELGFTQNEANTLLKEIGPTGRNFNITEIAFLNSYRLDSDNLLDKSELDGKEAKIPFEAADQIIESISTTQPATETTETTETTDYESYLESWPKTNEGRYVMEGLKTMSGKTIPELINKGTAMVMGYDSVQEYWDDVEPELQEKMLNCN